MMNHTTEKYLLEQGSPALSRAEQQIRESKADMIRKMIAGTANTEKERLLAVNQAMARQVVRKSKDMAGINIFNMEILTFNIELLG